MHQCRRLTGELTSAADFMGVKEIPMTDTDNDMDLFNSAISGETSTETVESTPEAETSQEPVRDEQGRFAETPAAPEVAETPAQQEPQAPVPVAAVQDERRKRQEAERRAGELERRIAEIEARVSRPQTPVQPETPSATLWDDPDAYLKGQLAPVQQAIAEMRDLQMETQAQAALGADKVMAAKEAVKAYFNKPEGAMIHQELMSGGNPYVNLVKWHERQQTLERVGNDPDAWLEKQLDNPEFLAKALERAKATAQGNNAGNRASAPLVNLPPSLSRLPAGSTPATENGQSDYDMFAAATSNRRA